MLGCKRRLVFSHHASTGRPTGPSHSPRATLPRSRTTMPQPRATTTVLRGPQHTASICARERLTLSQQSVPTTKDAYTLPRGRAAPHNGALRMAGTKHCWCIFGSKCRQGVLVICRPRTSPRSVGDCSARNVCHQGVLVTFALGVCGADMSPSSVGDNSARHVAKQFL